MHTWTVEKPGDLASAELDGVQVQSEPLVTLAPLAAGRNLAQGRPVTDDFGRSQAVLTDGSIAGTISEWVSGTANVYGRSFTVDLGMDRAVARVRVLAGESALSQPEYLIRGYLIEGATADQPSIWRTLAEQRTNFVLNVDTSQDSTWQVKDQQRAFLPELSRYVRLTLVRQDRSNWVAIGELEVYGAGYTEAGQVSGTLAGPAPVNVGRVRWVAQTPARTQVQVQLRQGEEEWVDEAQEGLFGGSEPLSELQYRAILTTGAPFASPGLLRLEVEYDPVLVARQVWGTVAPDTVPKAVPAAIRYAAALVLEPGNYGVDELRLEGVTLSVDTLRVAGRVLPRDESLAEGYRWQSLLAQEATLIELAPAERIAASATVEVAGTGLFLGNLTRVRVQVANREQGERDGYLNWQNGIEAPGGSWTVRAMGAPPQALSKVEVEPRPFSPRRDGQVEFHFVVGNLQETVPVVIRLYSMDGRAVRRLEESGRAREYRLYWDGKDQDGRDVPPGLYLYELTVEAGNGSPSRRGTVVVAY